MLKNDCDQWVRQGRAEELNELHNTPFCVPVQWGGSTHNVSVGVQFRFFLPPTTTICGGKVGEGVVLCVRGSGIRVFVSFFNMTCTHSR